ncbi:Kinesin- protein 12 [Tyrophagus putrescentiae]|nr:Kinesin- protein 12 [Tyrophagus putrescentiae]
MIDSDHSSDWASSASASNGGHGTPTTDHTINVVIRVRPLITGHGDSAKGARANSTSSGSSKAVPAGDSDGTSEEQSPTAITFPAAGQIQVYDTIAATDRSFGFNVIFEPEARQEDVFEHSGVKRLIDMALDGFACTVFAYGQTSTGKTFTLTGNVFQIEAERQSVSSHRRGQPASRSSGGSHRGKPSSSSHSNGNLNGAAASAAAPGPKNIGIVQLSFAYLFEQIKRRKLRDKTLYVITVSYLEIYNEQVLDLLNPSPRCLNVRWAKDRGFYAENLFKVECEDIGDLEGVLEEGCKNRQVRSHSMNENSSRSHAVMTITLSSETPDPDDPQGFIRKEGRFCLVDLAGSEKTKRTNSKGGTFVEANNINRSLLVLGNCISCLADPKRRNGHIPYRDSVLTRLLQDSLNNAKVLMIACVSPLKCDSQETINTLRYACRAKRVRMNPVVQMDPRELLILSLKREVRSLRVENSYLRQHFQHILASSQPDENGVVSGVDKGTIMAILSSNGGSNQEANHDANRADAGGQLSLTVRENEMLRVENVQLNLQRNRLIRDHELVCRENERLLKQLQTVLGGRAEGKSLLMQQQQPRHRSSGAPLSGGNNIALLPLLSSSASSPSLLSLVSEEEVQNSMARLAVNSAVVGGAGDDDLQQQSKTVPAAAAVRSANGRSNSSSRNERQHSSRSSAPSEDGEELGTTENGSRTAAAEDTNDLILITQSRQAGDKLFDQSSSQSWSSSRSSASQNGVGGGSSGHRSSRHHQHQQQQQQLSADQGQPTMQLDLTIRGKSAVNVIGSGNRAVQGGTAASSRRRN